MCTYIAITTRKLVSSVSLGVILPFSVQAKVFCKLPWSNTHFWGRGWGIKSPFWLLNSPTAGNTTGLSMKRFEGKSQWEVETAGGERESCQPGVFSNTAYLGIEAQKKCKDALILLPCILSIWKQARKKRENSAINISPRLQYLKNDKLMVTPKTTSNNLIATNFPATCWENNLDVSAQN